MATARWPLANSDVETDMSDMKTENYGLESDSPLFPSLLLAMIKPIKARPFIEHSLIAPTSIHNSPFKPSIMPTIEFDFYEAPHAANSSAERYFPVVVERNKVTEHHICEYAMASTTLNEADIKAAFSMLAQYLADRLANGDRVELPGIGSLVLRIGSDEPITDCDDKQIARNLTVRGITFTPKKELMQTISQDIHFHRAKNIHQTAPALTDDELVSRLQAYILAGHEPVLSRADIQNATGYTRTRTNTNLPGWIERGLLIKLGIPRAPYYRLAPESAVEPQTDDVQA